MNSIAKENGKKSGRTRTSDPQVVLQGRVIPVRDGEAMVFEFRVWMFHICCIVNFPRFDDEKTAPVYVRLKRLPHFEPSDVVQPVQEGAHRPDVG